MGEDSLTPKGKKTRENILAAARTIFAHDGYVAMRMGDVAVEAGLSMGALYRYFQNKEDLFANLIANVHEDLYQAATAESDFATEPYQALLEANRGYLGCYYQNRDLMRALFEAVTVDQRDRDIWWQMRERHIDRYVYALKKVHGITKVGKVQVRRVVESMVSMVEQSAYCWYAHEELQQTTVPLDEAAQIVTQVWHQAIFGQNS